MASSSAMFSTLQHVTETKLAKLRRRQQDFEQFKTDTLAAVRAEKDVVKKVRILLEALEDRDAKFDSSEASKNFHLFLDQAARDPSIPPALIESWANTLGKELERQTARYDLTSLFGRLVMEWIQNPNDESAKPRAPSAGSDESENSVFEPVGREEMHEQRQQWELYAFHDVTTDVENIAKYLDGLFLSTSKSKKLKKSPLDSLREDIADFSETSPIRFDWRNIRCAIDGLLKEDLFAGEKRKDLQDLRTKKTVLTEIADVLNSDLDSLENWRWEPTPVPLYMRKQINGKYRVFMDEEVYQAIFVQLIGSYWAVHLKKAFTKFFRSGAWRTLSRSSLNKADLRRREHFLGSRAENDAKVESVRNHRRNIYKDDYFMTQLPDSLQEATRGGYGPQEDDDDDSDEEEQEAETSDIKSAGTIKQSILRLVTTEMLIGTHLHREFTYFQTDFKWFGPSLPHKTILAVLEYFHFPERWISFFQRFLQPTLAFAHDGPSAEPRVRVRGIPMSHTLSTACGEAVFFILDFAVNQRTGGANLHRFYDDLHFFGDTATCVTAWRAIMEFAAIMGLELNEEKSAAVVCSRSKSPPKIPSELPAGDVRWGFLKLRHDGRWEVDQDAINEHVVELRRQLKACRSVFAYIQAYNAYMAHFFINNMGRPANCLGREHLDIVIAAITRIQKAVLADDAEPETKQHGIASYLRGRIRRTESLGANTLSIPDGFFFFPIKLGGLDVQNPLHRLLLTREHVLENPSDAIVEALERDEEAYEKAKERYQAGQVDDRDASAAAKVDPDEPFLSLHEYTKSREERSVFLARAWEELMAEGGETVMPVTGEVRTRLAEYAAQQRGRPDAGGSRGAEVVSTRVRASGNARGRRRRAAREGHRGVQAEDRAGFFLANHRMAIEMYGNEVLERVGDLSLGERDLLPIGLVELLRKEKVRWIG